MDKTSGKDKSQLVIKQIEEFIDKIELKEKDIKERIVLCTTIQILFTKAGYTQCLVQPYGSTINGCGFQGCDLDLYISFGVSPTPSVCQAASLLSSSPLLTNVTAVPQARVPIVRAVDKKTGISLDLSFDCQASLWNTEFIRSCCYHDHRVRPLIMLVRYWAKQNGVTGRQESQVKLCNYALTMLVIGYLQQLSHPVLPSLKRVIQQSGQPIAWHSLGQLPKVKKKNNFSLLQLLAGFFFHYHSFPFNKNAVSVYYGQVRLKTKMQRDLQQIMESAGEQPLKGSPLRIQSDTSMCVQDPFEPQFNMTRVVTNQGLAIFQCQLYLAALVTKTFLSPVELTNLVFFLVSDISLGSTVDRTTDNLTRIIQDHQMEPQNMDLHYLLKYGREQLLEGNWCSSSNQIIGPVLLQNSFKPGFNMTRGVGDQSLAALHCQLYKVSLVAENFPSPVELNGTFPGSGVETINKTVSQIHTNSMRLRQPYSRIDLPESNFFLYNKKMPPWWLKWRGFDERR